MRIFPPLHCRAAGVAVLLLALLPGCLRRAHRPESSLSEHERAVLAAYENVRAGLAGDDPHMAKRGALSLYEEVKKGGAGPSSAQLLAQAEALSNANALDNARALFKPLSTTLLPMAANVDGYYIMTSPPGLGGDWIQRTPDVDNPYLGPIMHSAGSLKK